MINPQEEENHDMYKNLENIKTIIIKQTRKPKNKNPQKQYKKNKKRVVSERWNLPIEYLTFEKQIEMIHSVHENNDEFFDSASKILIREIERKIYGYKQQDIEKHMLNQEQFLSLKDVISKMIDCKMKCYYCDCEMYLLYEIVRESKQWSVDRLDNDQGHNLNNYVLACLECNLKRRRRTAEKYLFTKQLNIVKTD
jgi:hypothetical protein